MSQPRRPHHLLPLAFLLLAACGGDGRQKLVLYSPHGPELLEVVEPAFEAAHPEIDLQWLGLGSQAAYDRIRSERANPQADVWYGGPATIFARGAEEGLLAAFRPSWAAAIPPAGQAQGDLYFSLYRTAPVLAYNTAGLPAAAAPRDWDDLLRPELKGKILMRDPLESGTMRTLFGMVLARSLAETGSLDRGWQWLRQLDAQTKEYVLNPALMMEKLSRQEGLVTVWELTDMLWQEQRGKPLAFHFASSGTPVIEDSIGLVAGCRHAEAGRTFIEWAGSPQAMRLAAEKAFRLPARTDLPAAELPAWAQRVLAELKPVELDRGLMARESAGWMSTWDREVRGRGAQP